MSDLRMQRGDKFPRRTCDGMVIALAYHSIDQERLPDAGQIVIARDPKQVTVPGQENSKGADLERGRGGGGAGLHRG